MMDLIVLLVWVVVLLYIEVCIFGVGVVAGASSTTTSVNVKREVLVVLGWPFTILLESIIVHYTGKSITERVVEWKQSAADKIAYWKCDHDNIEQCGDYTVNGKKPEKICKECGYTWWKQ